MGGRDHLGMIGQPEIIVGAEIKHFPRFRPLRIRNPDIGLLAGQNHPLVLEQSRFPYLDQLLDIIIFYTCIHILSSVIFPAKFTPILSFSK
jgi:hypothetical protein